MYSAVQVAITRLKRLLAPGDVHSAEELDPLHLLVDITGSAEEGKHLELVTIFAAFRKLLVDHVTFA